MDVATMMQTARALYQTEPDWPTFFREVLGVDGLVRRTIFGRQTLAEFALSPEYAELQAMLTRLRAAGGDASESESLRVITVRLPASLHALLRVESAEQDTSINQLCITKLLAPVDTALVPRSRP